MTASFGSLPASNKSMHLQFAEHSLMPVWWLQPFGVGSHIFGSLAWGLAGIIDTLDWYGTTKQQMYTRNAWFGMQLTGAVMAAFILRLPGLGNIAVVILMLWLLVKIWESTYQRHYWVIVFAMSLLAWRPALWLHMHPAFLNSLVDW